MNSQKTIWNKKRSAKRTANHANRAYVINRMSIKALNSKEQYWKKKKRLRSWSRSSFSIISSLKVFVITKVVRDVLPYGIILLGLFVMERLIKARNINKYCREWSTTIFTKSVHRIFLGSSSACLLILHFFISPTRTKFFTNTYNVSSILRCSIKTPWLAANLVKSFE